MMAASRVREVRTVHDARAARPPRTGYRKTKPAYAPKLLEWRDGADRSRPQSGAVGLRLLAFTLRLQEVAYGTNGPDANTPPANSGEEASGA